MASSHPGASSVTSLCAA
ncbi:hypothetical protein HaLaN_28693, partial [Haematococcus lacustris]